MTSTTRLAVAGAVATALATLPLAPLMATAHWTIPATLAVSLVFLTGWVMRRYRVPGVVVFVGQLVVVTLWLGVLVASDVAWMGMVPTREWAERLFLVAADGAEAVQRYGPPVPVEQGLLMFIVAGAGLTAIAVDLALFGLRRVPLAGLPLAAFYAVSAGVLHGDLWWGWFVPPAAGFLGLLVTESSGRVSRCGRSAGPSTRHSGLPETGSLARNGRRLGALAIAAAVGIPAAAPALADGLLDMSGSGSGAGGGRTIRTDNPIVDLQGNLNRPDNVILIQYTTDTNSPEYIRQTVLDVVTNEGEVWTPSQREVPESQRVDDGLPSPAGLDTSVVEVTEVEYRFQISENLGSQWLPLPHPAQEIIAAGDFRYDRNTLDVVAGDGDVQGLYYEVTSLDVDLNAEVLREAPPPPDDLEDMLELPEDLPDIVTDLANEVVAEAETGWDQAVALQAWFRSTANFTYDTTPNLGMSSSAIAEFLTRRVGFCQQFAATMVLMSRSLGIPARLAVGFTPGQSQDDGTRVVRAHDAHAWPELYFEGVGWVRFEPTPAQRTGAAPGWTVPSQTDGPDVADDDLTAAGLPTPPPGGSLIDAEQDAEAGGAGAGIGAGPAPVPVAVLSVAAVAAVAALPTTLARARRDHRWRRAAGDPVREAEAAWSDFRDAVRDAGWGWDPAETPRRAGQRAIRSVGPAAGAGDLIEHLVRTTERARYARTAQAVPGLKSDAAALRGILLGAASAGRRLRAWLWPAAVSDLLDAAGARIGNSVDSAVGATEQLRQSLDRLKPRLRRS